jgi:hypothetical protein
MALPTTVPKFKEYIKQRVSNDADVNVCVNPNLTDIGINFPQSMISPTNTYVDIVNKIYGTHDNQHRLWEDIRQFVQETIHQTIVSNCFTAFYDSCSVNEISIPTYSQFLCAQPIGQQQN